jgi:hypothetical protein
VAIEEGEDGAEGQGGVDAALLLKDLVGLHKRGGEVPYDAVREVTPPEQAIAALRVGARGGVAPSLQPPGRRGAVAPGRRGVAAPRRRGVAARAPS